MATVRFGYTPTHPGEVLKDEIEYRKVSQRKGYTCRFVDAAATKIQYAASHQQPLTHGAVKSNTQLCCAAVKRQKSI